MFYIIDEKIMGIGRKIMAGIALVVAERGRKRRRGEEKPTDRHELMISY